MYLVLLLVDLMFSKKLLQNLEVTFIFFYDFSHLVD